MTFQIPLPNGSTAEVSSSYPYLSFSRLFALPYADVLRFVDVLDQSADNVLDALTCMQNMDREAASFRDKHDGKIGLTLMNLHEQERTRRHLEIRKIVRDNLHNAYVDGHSREETRHWAKSMEVATEVDNLLTLAADCENLDDERVRPHVKQWITDARGDGPLT